MLTDSITTLNTLLDRMILTPKDLSRCFLNFPKTLPRLFMIHLRFSRLHEYSLSLVKNRWGSPRFLQDISNSVQQIFEGYYFETVTNFFQTLQDFPRPIKTYLSFCNIFRYYLKILVKTCHSSCTTLPDLLMNFQHPDTCKYFQGLCMTSSAGRVFSGATNIWNFNDQARRKKKRQVLFVCQRRN